MEKEIFVAHVKTESCDEYIYGYWEEKPNEEKLIQYLEEEDHLFMPSVTISKITKSEIDV